MNIHARLARGIGFGALAMAGLGLLEAGVIHGQPEPPLYGGGGQRTGDRRQKAEVLLPLRGNLSIRRNNEALLVILL